MVLGEPGVIGIDESFDLLVERNVGPRNREDAGNELRGDEANGASEVGFGSEVVVQQRLVYACLIGDVLHPRTVDAAPHEHFVGGVEDTILVSAAACPDGLTIWSTSRKSSALSYLVFC